MRKLFKLIGAKDICAVTVLHIAKPENIPDLLMVRGAFDVCSGIFLILKVKRVIAICDFLTLRYGFKAFSLFIEEF